MMKTIINKRMLSLLASITLISGPALIVVGCNSEIARYNAALSNDLQNRILFDFVGVNFNVNAKSQFSAAYKQGIDFLKKEVEGVMAQQKFYNIFIQKLDYTEEEAEVAFNTVKDNLALDLLANDYFSTVNSGENFDNKVYKNKLIFQTENWHQVGTIKFDYSKSEFYSQTDNNPDTIFTPGYLYDPTKLNDPDRDAKIKEVAKHADETFNKELPKLTEEKLKWTNPVPETQLPPSLGSDSIENYQKKLERFKWWLRFRYQQYYQATILPQLNETLFTMSNIFDSILNITPKNGNTPPKVQIADTTYAGQLQDWTSNSVWTSRYRWIWDYTTSITNARNINDNWSEMPVLMKNAASNTEDPTLNDDFFKRLAGSDQTLKNTVDPVLGINGYINDSNGKVYDSTVKATNISEWVGAGDNTHYWGQNNKGTFAYSSPVYWIDVVQNLNFNYYKPESTTSIIPDKNSWTQQWNTGGNSSISSTNFSKYMRADNTTSSSPNYNNIQSMKWNTFWQMIYFLSSQAETNSNKEKAKDNFTTAAKAIYPEFIKKENIYNNDFWDVVKSYY